MCDLLLEESNVQPVSTPVTVCGDIHGQVEFYTDYSFGTLQHQRGQTIASVRVCKYLLMGRQLLYLKPLVKIFFLVFLEPLNEGGVLFMFTNNTRQSV